MCFVDCLFAAGSTQIRGGKVLLFGVGCARISSRGLKKLAIFGLANALICSWILDLKLGSRKEPFVSAKQHWH